MLRAAVRDLRRDFNASLTSKRLVLLVSPTCPDCQRGAGIVAAALERHPTAEVRVLVLWVNGVSGDSMDAATNAAAVFAGSDARTSHYWEEGDGWSLPAAFRPVLGLGPRDPQEIAWDVYLYYAPTVRWLGAPPAPTAWAHNLRDAPCPSCATRIEDSVVDAWLAGGPTVA